MRTRGRLKGQSTGGRAEQAQETPRAGRRRNGGLAVTTIRTMLHRKASSCLIFARGSGPRVPAGFACIPGPGVPRALLNSGRELLPNPGRNRAAETRAHG